MMLLPDDDDDDDDDDGKCSLSHSPCVSFFGLEIKMPCITFRA
jgi:hypothetical protein